MEGGHKINEGGKEKGRGRGGTDKCVCVCVCVRVSLTFLRPYMLAGRTVTVSTVCVAVWIFRFILFAVVFAAPFTLAQLNDLHVMDGSMVTVLTAKSATACP